LFDRISLNYARIIQKKSFFKTYIRIGFNIPIQNGNYYITTLMLNRFFGKKNLHFEIGIGSQIVYYDPDHHTYGAFTALLEAKYEDKKSGILIRGGITPTIGNFWKSHATYFGAIVGLSIGYNF
jgi:hypothetical protein